jgi:tetratricopeptide (TPR) repeat protein
VLGSALGHELAVSSFVSVTPRARVADALLLMRLPPDAALDLELARQVALRDGGIGAVVAGEVVRLGDGLTVRARLVAASDGEELGSWSETSGSAVAEIQAALVRIARGVRQRLGESLNRIEAGGEGRQRVTTPSWQALRLFDEAEAVIARFGLDDAAEELLREAIREDPGFASAHIFLAHALHNQRRPREEVVAAAERAMALAEGVSDRERFFIRGSYYLFAGDAARSRANYEALLRLDPDHYWANNNLAVALGPTPGIPYMVRKGRARPNDLDANWDAAHALAIVGGRLDEAQPFVERIVELASIEIQRLQEYEAAWGRQWQAHRSWLAGDLEGARRELDSRAKELAGQSGAEAFWTRTLLIHGYRALGLSRAARDLVVPPETRWRLPYFAGLDALLAGDPAGARAGFGSLDRTGAWPGLNLLEDPTRVAALARSGALDEARRALDSFRSVERYFVPEFEEDRRVLESLMAAELELAAGGDAVAAETLERIFGHDWEQYGASYHLAAQGLARAYRRLGRDDEAVAALAGAVAKRERSYPLGRELSLATEMELADLLRELGRIDEARQHEAELERFVRLADSEFWLRHRLASRAGG